MTEPTPDWRVVRGSPNEIEVAALVAGLTAVTSGTEPDDVAPVDEWSNHIRVLRGTGGGASARSFGGRSGRHHSDAWRWSFRS